MSAIVRILVLGGTAFVGRATVEDALRSGAEVTLFGRGKTGTDLFPGVARLRGDRDTGEVQGVLVRTAPRFPLVRMNWPAQQRA